MQAPLPDAALDRLFRTARSANGYTDEPVSEDQLRALYDLVKMGPTSANQFPARFGAYLTMAARALGLDTGPMSGFDAAAVDRAFFADQPRVTVNYISTLGYADHATIFDRSPRPAFEKFNRLV